MSLISLESVKPIQVSYEEPATKQRINLRFNPSRVENAERFVKLMIWASKYDVPLTIRAIPKEAEIVAA